MFWGEAKVWGEGRVGMIRGVSGEDCARDNVNGNIFRKSVSEGTSP